MLIIQRYCVTYQVIHLKQHWQWRVIRYLGAFHISVECSICVSFLPVTANGCLPNNFRSLS